MLIRQLINFFKKYSRLFTALFFTFLGLYLRFKSLAERELWGDEIYQIAMTAGPFKPIWQRFTSGDFTCFPGGYWINYPFVKFFGSNKWCLNIPHYFTAILGFFFLYLLCKKYLKTFCGWTAAFLVFCFNSHLIFHTFEFRPYAVLPTLSLASFYFSGIIVSDWQRISTLKKFLIGIFFIYLIIYHAYGILIAGLCFLYFIILEANKKLHLAKGEIQNFPYEVSADGKMFYTLLCHKSSYKDVIKRMLPFLLSAGLSGFLLFIWYMSKSWINFHGRTINTFDYYPNPLYDFIHFIRQVSFNLMAHKQYGQKHLALGIWITFLLPHKDRFKQMGFFLLMIILPISLILLLDLYSGYWFLDRQFVWVMSLYAFFLGWCWDTIFIYVQKKTRKSRLRREDFPRRV